MEVRGFQRILLVADVNTFPVLGQAALGVLARGRHSVPVQVFPESHDLRPDEEAVSTIRAAIQTADVEVAVAVGSGVINDLVRYATDCEQIPYVAVPTAPSMDGYASAVAAMQFQGVKVTFPAQAPIGIFAQPHVLAEAPAAMVRSGFGDLMGKVIALADWKLAHRLYGEYFCEFSYQLMQGALQAGVRQVTGLQEQDPEAIGGLFRGLIVSGLAMAFVGNSRPASGSEHHCSHYWDFLAYSGQRAHTAHGLQVGYATQWVMDLYRVLTTLPTLRRPVMPVLDGSWEESMAKEYGAGAPAVIAQQQEKQRWLTERTAFWAPDIGGLITALQPEWQAFDEIEQALDRLGMPHQPGAFGIPPDMLAQTLEHAHELRSRYTILDFFSGQGRRTESIQQILGVL
jgi:glycerol-1-phosphate dehydrogenase [NAD(P)+]